MTPHALVTGNWSQRNPSASYTAGPVGLVPHWLGMSDDSLQSDAPKIGSEGWQRGLAAKIGSVPLRRMRLAIDSFPFRWQSGSGQWAVRLPLDFKPGSVLPSEHRVGLFVSYNRTLFGIPIEFAVESDSNVGQVADLEHAVVRPDVGNRLFS